MIKQWTNDKGVKYLFVEVPKDAHSLEIIDNQFDGGKHICFLRGIPDYACEYTCNVPNSSLIIGLSKDLTEEQCEVIVDKYFHSCGTLKDRKSVV